MAPVAPSTPPPASDAPDPAGPGTMPPQASDAPDPAGQGTAPRPAASSLSNDTPTRPSPIRSLQAHRGDVAGIACLVLVALAYLSPALKDGPSFGPADLGRGLSVLTSLGPAAPPVHDVINGDIITQGVAWNTLDWTLVHHGELPLWNDLSGTGLPQLLNFESAPLALPSLVGYLFPLSLAFLVGVAIKLLVAGTGAYLLTRLLGGRPLAGVLAGATFMVSGSLAGWLGWSVSGPLVWAGWLLAAAVLCYRAPPGRRAGPVALLAISAGLCVYGGFPESYVLLAGALLVVVCVTGLVTVASRRKVAWAGVGWIGAGLGAGLALSSPLWLPGISVLRASVRNGQDASVGLPLHAITLLFAQGYDGLPLGTPAYPHGTYFGPVDYFETAAYVGVVALVLGLTCLVTSWRRPVVAGLGLSAAACGLVVYDLGSGAPVQHLVRDAGLGGIALQRALPLLGFAIAILAGLGLETLCRHWRERGARLAFDGSVAVLAVVLAALWAQASSPAVELTGGGGVLTGTQATSLRESSLLWPTAEVAVLVVVAILLGLAARGAPAGGRAPAGLRVATAGIVAAQAAFLVVAGVGINSYAPSAYPVTPAVSALRKVAGTSLVGLDGVNESCGTHPVPPCGLRQWEGIGLYPAMNLGYGLAELAMHDPTIPKAYFDAYPVSNNDQSGGGTNLFAPSIDTVALARLYGVSYVIVQPPQEVPAGMRLVGTIIADGVHLKIAFVPGSGQFGFVAPPGTSGLVSRSGATGVSSRARAAGVSSRARAAGRSDRPGAAGRSDRPDTVVSVSHPGDASYRLGVSVPRTGTLAIRITDFAGWHASADGRPVAIRRAAGDLMSVVVPAGTTSVVLTYRPRLLEVGFLFALAGLVALAGFGGVEAFGGLEALRASIRRRRSTTGAEG